jgi:hypothetical protein
MTIALIVSATLSRLSAQERLRNDVPSHSTPQNLPCVDQPKSLKELTNAFSSGTMPSSSDMTGTWVAISSFIDTYDSTMNCMGLKRGTQIYEEVIIANGYSLELHVVGTGIQRLVARGTRQTASVFHSILAEIQIPYSDVASRHEKPSRASSMCTARELSSRESRPNLTKWLRLSNFGDVTDILVVYPFEVRTLDAKKLPSWNRRGGAKRRGGRQTQNTSGWFIIGERNQNNLIRMGTPLTFATTPALRATPPVPGGEFLFPADRAQFQTETPAKFLPKRTDVDRLFRRLQHPNGLAGIVRLFQKIRIKECEWFNGFPGRKFVIARG